MKILSVVLFISCLTTSSSVVFFDNRIVLFGVRGGAKKSGSTDGEGRSVAGAIFHAVESVERRLEKAIEDEVNSVFHNLHEDKKSDVHQKTKKAVAVGAKKVKKEVESHKDKTTFPYEGKYPYDLPHSDEDHRTLHAIESAEKAFLHAVQDEVETIFHDLKHHDDDELSRKAVESAKKALDRATAKVQDKTEHRRESILGQGLSVDEYIRSYTSMDD